MAFDELHKDVYNGLKNEWKKSPWTVSSVLCLWVVAWGVFIFIYPRLAQSGEVNSVKSQVESLVVDMLDREILTTQKMRCQAESKIFFTSRLSDLMRRYYEITKVPYPLPSCGDLT